MDKSDIGKDDPKTAGTARVWLFTGGMFFALLLLAWVNEIADLPHRLLGAVKTPVNWRESLIESVVIVIVGGLTLSRLLTFFRERRRAEKALARSEEKFRTLAEFTYDWELWEGVDGRLVYVSPSCREIAGFDRAEFLSDPGLLERIVHPDDLEIFRAHQALHGSDQCPESLDYRILTGDGVERWISHHCQPVCNRDGAPLGRRISNRDVSRRKAAMAELEKALAEIKVLRGLIPICSKCNKIRDDNGSWHRIEDYVEARSEAVFTHGLCQECAHELYGEYLED